MPTPNPSPGRRLAALGIAATAAVATFFASSALALETPTLSGVAVPQAPRSFGPAIEEYPSYAANREKTCDDSAKAGPLSLIVLLRETYGYRTGYITRTCPSSGIGASGHHAGRALDWGVDQYDQVQVDETWAALNWMLATDEHGNDHAIARRLGLMYIIFEGKMFRMYDTDRGWTEYSDCLTNPAKADPKYSSYCHRGHVHFSFTWEGAHGETSFYRDNADLRGACETGQMPSGRAPQPPGELGFTAIDPVRVVDSRTGLGTPGDCWLGTRDELLIDIAGRDDIPADAAAVTLNVTATNPRGAGWLRAWPTGSYVSTSSVNFAWGGSTAVMVTVPVGTDGHVSLISGVAATDVVVDVMGYYSQAGVDAFTPLTPQRVFDETVAGGQARVINPGVPADASAVLANITGDRPGGETFLSATPTAPEQITTSTVNTLPGRAVANRAATGLAADGTFSLFSHAPQRSIVDVAGWFGGSAGTSYTPLAPTRVLDTREKGQAVAPLKADATQTIPSSVFAAAGVPSDAKAVAMTLTIDGSSARTYVSAWPSGAPWPGTSDINVDLWYPQAAYATTALSADGGVDVKIGSGAAHLIIDVLGYYR